MDRAQSALTELGYLVGNTPMLAIDYRYGGVERTLYTKAENFNLTESIKDRMVLHILGCAYRDPSIEPGAPLVEATSGNTGISLAAIGRALGHPVVIYMPDWMNQERCELIRSLGAEVRLVSKEEGGFVGSIRASEDYAARTPGAFLPRQLANESNTRAHEMTTGPEIWSQLEEHDLTPDAFVAGVGTGGTVMGVGRYLRSRKPSVGVHPLEPASSPTLSTGCKVGQHRIQGISDEFVPPIVDLRELDTVVQADDGDSILMARALARELGLGVGISSGANVLGAIKVQASLPAGAAVATVFPDSNKKYLSTDLMRDEPARDGYLTPEVELLGYHTFRRSCGACGGRRRCGC